MPEIKWPKGRSSFLTKLARYRSSLTSTLWLCFDPATGGGESRPGYAFFVAGTPRAAGVLHPRGSTLEGRLLSLRKQLKQLVESQANGRPVVLFVEELKGSHVHSHLHWATGAAVSAYPWLTVIEVPICFWKAHAATDAGYSKGDMNDAIQLGRTCAELLRGDHIQRLLAVPSGRRTKRRGTAGPGRLQRRTKKTKRGGTRKCR